MIINTVKLHNKNYLVNAFTFVPFLEDNLEYQQVKGWLRTKTPEPEFNQEELDGIAYAETKQAKILAVSQILVTSSTGKVFDGDEISQGRMARAVVASSVGDTTLWKLADNTQATVTHGELKEVLLLAGNAMTEIWMA